MKTYFIRHSPAWHVPPEVRPWLWEGRRTAIRFEDKKSVDPNDYCGQGARRAVKAFKTLAEYGGYVCATTAPYDGCLVAEVPRGTSICSQCFTFPTDPASIAVLKVIALPNARVIPADKANRLLIGQPQQGTITPWNIVGDRVKQFVQFGDIMVTELDHLLPYEQEVMCAEFLRTAMSRAAGLPLLTCLTAPVGRTRKAIDISGVSPDGLPIYAQVTHKELNNPETKEKSEALLNATRGAEARRIMFCRAGTPGNHDGIEYYPIQRVFDAMKTLPIWRAAFGVQEAG